MRAARPSSRFRNAAASSGPSTTASASPAPSSRSSSTRPTRTRSSPSPTSSSSRSPNYEALPLAAALDFARIALVPAISSAKERSVKLLQAPLTGLGTGLQEAEAESNECALSEFAWASQSLMVEARSLAHPLSTETASTMLAEGIEDRITMAPLAARRLSEQVAVAEELLALGLISPRRPSTCAAARRSGGTARAYAQVRERYAFVAAGESIGPDRSEVVELVRSGALGAGG